MNRLDKCLDWIIAAEGGIANDPRDRGGLTKYGISQAAYPSLDIAKLTEADAKAIYIRDYWTPCKCAHLPAGVDLVVFDSAVMMGVFASSVHLQRALNVTPDGDIGPKTLAAATARGTEILPALLTERMFYLMATPTWKVHRRGWTLRTFRLAHEVM